MATEDTGVVSLRFAGGALGSLVQIAPPGRTHTRRPELVVYGTQGTLIVRMGEAVECFGRRLAFISNRGGGYGIYLLEVE